MCEFFLSQFIHDSIVKIMLGHPRKKLSLEIEEKMQDKKDDLAEL